MTQHKDNSVSGKKSSSTMTTNNTNTTSAANSNLGAQASADPNQDSHQQTTASAAQQMAYETGLDYTSDVIRQDKLKAKNQKAASSLVDRMYWQREESLSKSINVSDKGELEDYDDTPGLGSDKPGV